MDKEKDRRFSRKDFFGLGLKSIAGFALDMFAETADRIDQSFPALVRPPGALVPEEAFLGKCRRCLTCQRACPFFAIRVFAVPGSFFEGTPHLLFRDTFCHMCPDTPCITACPSGALTREKPGWDKIGLAKVSSSTCLRKKGTDCTSCLTACPTKYSAISHVAGHPLPAISETLCCGCGACEKACPVDPGPAIVVEPL